MKKRSNGCQNCNGSPVPSVASVASLGLVFLSWVQLLNESSVFGWHCTRLTCGIFIRFIEHRRELPRLVERTWKNSQFPVELLHVLKHLHILKDIVTDCHIVCNSTQLELTVEVLESVRAISFLSISDTSIAAVYPTSRRITITTLNSFDVDLWHLWLRHWNV